MNGTRAACMPVMMIRDIRPPSRMPEKTPPWVSSQFRPPEIWSPMMAPSGPSATRVIGPTTTMLTSGTTLRCSAAGSHRLSSRSTQDSAHTASSDGITVYE
ncbi:hypothetical protein EBM89_16350 [Cellulomonas triticagri]|uniref:Uncharacterized protein n=1 Tax=Cellulomonas triticagri TaxID=2483352 RepID=A0A3M2IZB2_9CELL|nr:hypothetical protein EBM89_16350 [Cellulomonas triticagri]